MYMQAAARWRSEAPAGGRGMEPAPSRGRKEDQTMRSRIRSLRTMMVVGAVLVAPFAAVAAEPRVAPLDTTVAIENVRSNDVDVRGTVVNRTGDQLENVRLIVADKFLWHNERHPGENSPGDAHDVVV